MRKTKIVCTLGPSTDKGDVLRQLIENGMNVARFNFSHGDYDEHRGRFEKLKALREELGKPVGSDAEQQKATFATVLGTERAQSLAEKLTRTALDALKQLNVAEDDPLYEMTVELCSRKK